MSTLFPNKKISTCRVEMVKYDNPGQYLTVRLAHKELLEGCGEGVANDRRSYSQIFCDIPFTVQF